MNQTGVLLFLTAYATAVALPGPGMMALIARVLSRGRDGVVFYIAGFVIGDLVWFAAAVMGLSVLAASLSGAITLIRYLGGAYLFYLAYQLMKAEPKSIEDQTVEAEASPMQDISTGLLLTLGNPKVIIFFLALLPSVVNLHEIGVAEGLKLGLAMAMVLSGVLAAYALLADRARRLFRNDRAARALNVGSGAVMAGAAVAIVTR